MVDAILGTYEVALDSLLVQSRCAYSQDNYQEFEDFAYELVDSVDDYRFPNAVLRVYAHFLLV